MAAARRFSVFLLLIGSLAACARKEGGASNYGCGFAAMAGQSLLLDQFNRPGTTLAAAPVNLPGVLPVRLALGPALRSIVGRTDTMLVIGVEGTLPVTPQPGFGVLIVNLEGEAQGVLLYEGTPIKGAPRLGTVNVGARDLPLIGLRVDLARFENRSCPTFPDSLKG